VQKLYNITILNSDLSRTLLLLLHSGALKMFTDFVPLIKFWDPLGCQYSLKVNGNTHFHGWITVDEAGEGSNNTDFAWLRGTQSKKKKFL